RGFFRTGWIARQTASQYPTGRPLPPGGPPAWQPWQGLYGSRRGRLPPTPAEICDDSSVATYNVSFLATCWMAGLGLVIQRIYCGARIMRSQGSQASHHEYIVTDGQRCNNTFDLARANGWRHVGNWASFCLYVA